MEISKSSENAKNTWSITASRQQKPSGSLIQVSSHRSTDSYKSYQNLADLVNSKKSQGPPQANPIDPRRPSFNGFPQQAPLNRVTKRFKLAFFKLRCAFAISKLSRDVRVYGATTHLFDAEMKLNPIDKAQFHKYQDQGLVEVKEQATRLNRMFMVWNAIISLILIWVTPFSIFHIAFEQSDVGTKVFDLIWSILFVADVTVYVLKRQYVQEFLHNDYFKRYILFDLVAWIPFTWCVEENEYDGKVITAIVILTILKSLKFKKSVDWVMSVNALAGYKSVIFVVTFLILVAMMLHIAACVWFFIAKVTLFAPDTWVARKGIVDEDSMLKYEYSFYWALTTLTTVGYGDVTAETRNELYMSLIWMFFGVIFYTCIISILTTTLTNKDVKQAQIDDKLMQFLTLAKHKKLPKQLISKYMIELTGKSDALWLNESQTQDMLTYIGSDTLVNLVYSMNNETIRSFEFFTSQSQDFLTKYVPLMQYKHYGQDALIYKVNQFADYIYFIANGKVNFFHDQLYIKFRSMIAGGWFGEIEIFENILRHFSVRTAEASDFYVLDRGTVAQIEITNPEVIGQMKGIAAAKQDIIQKCLEQFEKVISDVSANPTAQENSECEQFMQHISSKLDASPTVKSRTKSNTHKIEGLSRKGSFSPSSSNGSAWGKLKRSFGKKDNSNSSEIKNQFKTLKGEIDHIGLKILTEIEKKFQ